MLVLPLLRGMGAGGVTPGERWIGNGVSECVVIVVVVVFERRKAPWVEYLETQEWDPCTEISDPRAEVCGDM